MRISRLKHNQDGLISFVVTILVMMILSLIVLGFARQSSREQRQALDSQLSTQAFYAAEAGVADAVEALKANPSLTKTDCSPIAELSDTNLNSTASYTCVLIDPNPTSAEYSNVNTSPVIVPIISNSGANINQIRFWWHHSDGVANNSFNGCPNTTTDTFVAQWPSNCDAGLLRIDLVPFPTTGTNSRTNLIDNQMTIFVRPNDEGSPATVSYTGGHANQGSVHQTECDQNLGSNPRLCRATINGLNAVPSTRWYARVSSIHLPSNLLIEMTDGGGGTAMRGNQAIVDVTGKATDVLRRIRVRVPIFEGINPSSQFVSQTASTLCKRLVVIGTDSSVNHTDPSCQVN